ncbi:MAG TPA: PEP-utilizing enzyme [Acidimicrobiia bacterium]|nr:PEP-utilizing enzyme [Acidimicrobiia bacterium]
MLDWQPPGPGGWSSLSDHFDRSLTPAYRRVFQEAFASGTAVAYARYGVLVDHLRAEFVNGHMYLRPVPLVMPDRAVKRPPPGALIWLMCRVHPAFRRRNRAARDALAERRWLADNAGWYEEHRPAWIERNRELQGEEPGLLADDELASHLERCQANWRAGYTLHFELHGPDLVPLGLLLARGEDWGLSVSEVLEALPGSSPSSTGHASELDELRKLVATSGRTPATLDEVRDVGPKAVELLDRYLADRGWRMTTSYDVDGRALVELPELTLAAILAPPANPETARARAETVASALRQRVPESDRAEFDGVLDDARRTYGLRDDNGMYTAAWPVGLVRRAMLEAGRRLVDRELLRDRDHVFELEIDEVRALLRDGTGPSAVEAESRAATRVAESAEPAPVTLGPPEPLPSFSAIPAPLLRVGRAILATRDAMYSTPADAPLAGTGIGEAPYRGCARVARQAEDAIMRMEPGDVLVTPTTTPAFNAVLAIAGGLIVEEGGLVSHAAVMARELGIPAVVGVAGAVDAIDDGATVEVDPGAGRVRVLHAAE